jgi:DNA-binding transcriptional regulator GbsR (MarR family)
MGGQWGVNRSVAQIQALLFLSERPLTAEDIAAKLGIARSNVSNSLRELLAWKLARRVPMLGDRRDHYEAETDLWQMATKVAQGRKEREIDPMVGAIRDAMAQINDPRISPAVRERLNAMHDFVNTVESWYQQMLSVPPAQIMRLIRMGSKVVGLLSLVSGGRKSKDKG